MSTLTPCRDCQMDDVLAGLMERQLWGCQQAGDAALVYTQTLVELVSTLVDAETALYDVLHGLAPCAVA